MALLYDLSPGMRADVEFYKKKNRPLTLALFKKINEIASRDAATIQFFKNLRSPLHAYKRVHVADSFILAFRFIPEKNFILFARFGHHDDVYRELLKQL